MKANKTEIRKQIKSLEAMKTCTTKEFNMSMYFGYGNVCDTALCIAGDAIVRRYGLRRGRKHYTMGTGFGDIETKAKEIFGITSNNLFHVGQWSMKNRNAYRRASWDDTLTQQQKQNAFINAGIAELKRYL